MRGLELAPKICYNVPCRGALAQLGERKVRNLEVRGSIPLCSTIKQSSVRMIVFYVINRGIEPERAAALSKTVR